MLTITPVDNIWLQIDAEPAILKELSDYFTFEADSAKFMRRQARFKGWDGRIRLFRQKDRTLYRGLLSRVIEFAEQRKYEYDNRIPGPIPFLPNDALDEWISTLDLPHTPRDYQIHALRECLRLQRGIVVSPTGSGKSFIIYLLMLALSIPRLLIVVPTTGLVQQMRNDFISYGWQGDIHCIQGGADKQTDAPIVISTWQSIYDMNPKFFNQYGCVVCDEVHLAQAKSLKALFEKIDCPYRFGFTGTLTDTQVHRLILEGLFGSVTQVTTTNALVKAKQLAPLHVDMCVLKYPESVRKQVRHFTYQEEVDFLVADPARALCVATLVSKLKGNTLVLFNLIDKHGKQLYEQIKALCPEKHVHFVTGIVDAVEREDVRQSVEDDEDGEHIIVASFGVFSTGVNLRRLHNLVFAAAGKSKIRTLQSIGRGLRTHLSKNHVSLYDIVDDLRIGIRRNYAWKHAEERSVLYAEEKFPVTIHSVNLEKFVEPNKDTTLSGVYPCPSLSTESENNTID